MCLKYEKQDAIIKGKVFYIFILVVVVVVVGLFCVQELMFELKSRIKWTDILKYLKLYIHQLYVFIHIIFFHSPPVVGQKFIERLPNNSKPNFYFVFLLFYICWVQKFFHCITYHFSRNIPCNALQWLHLVYFQFQFPCFSEGCLKYFSCAVFCWCFLFPQL